MKTFRTAILIAGILVAGLAYNSVAQTTETDNSANEEIFRLKASKKSKREHDKQFKHELKRELKASHKHELKQMVKSDRKAETHAYKSDLKHEAKAHKAEVKIHKARIRPHDKMKARKFKEKM